MTLVCNSDSSGYFQKQPFRNVLEERCSENMQQIYRRTPMPNCDFNNSFIEIAFSHWCSPVNLLHIFRILFPKNTSGRLLLHDLRFFSCTLSKPRDMLKSEQKWSNSKALSWNFKKNEWVNKKMSAMMVWYRL